MMKRVKFIKMVGSGNDFVVVDRRSSSLIHGSLSRLARLFCERRNGIGADGALFLGGSKKADFKMRVFNADGSEAEMCGNGLRCAALYAGRGRKGGSKIETMAGVYEAEITAKDRVKVRMKGPEDLRQDLSITVNKRRMKVNYIDTGVPHTVIFVQGIDGIDVDYIGRQVRYQDRFMPGGTNVDFVEIIDLRNIKMRTYERGVEGETLACGTGAAASAIITGLMYQETECRFDIRVHTKGGILRVYFDKRGNDIKDVYLEGGAKRVFEGGVVYV